MGPSPARGYWLSNGRLWYSMRRGEQHGPVGSSPMIGKGYCVPVNIRWARISQMSVHADDVENRPWHRQTSRSVKGLCKTREIVTKGGSLCNVVLQSTVIPQNTVSSSTK